jgi:hypothetical protein
VPPAYVERDKDELCAKGAFAQLARVRIKVAWRHRLLSQPLPGPMYVVMHNRHNTSLGKVQNMLSRRSSSVATRQRNAKARIDKSEALGEPRNPGSRLKRLASLTIRRQFVVAFGPLPVAFPS